MDPLKKAVARKGWDKSKWTQDAEGPVLSINIGGPVSGEPEQEAPEMEGPDDTGYDDGPLTPEEMDMPDDAPEEELEAARARFRQGQADQGEDPEWSDPYSEPSEGEYQANTDYYSKDPELDVNEIHPDGVKDIVEELKAKGIDPAQVKPSYLKSQYDLTTPEAFWLEKELKKAKAP